MSTIDTSQHYDYLFALTLFALNNSSLSLVRAIKSYVQHGNNTFASRINCHVEIGRDRKPRTVCCHVGVALINTQSCLQNTTYNLRLLSTRRALCARNFVIFQVFFKQILSEYAGAAILRAAHGD